MKHFRVIALTCLAVLLCQCGPSEWDVTLYSQKIEGTSKVLYKYDAWGGWDSHVAGYVILDSTETFNVNVSDLLPISQLNGIPNKNYISSIEVIEPNEKDTVAVYVPVNRTTMEKEGILVNIKNYDYDGFAKRGQGYEAYTFETFRETRDSLYFYNLDDIESIEHSHLDELKVKKGDIIIGQDINMIVTSVDIDDLILSEKGELLSNVSYRLTPKNPLKSNAFSDYGIFKEVFIEKKP